MPKMPYFLTYLEKHGYFWGVDGSLVTIELSLQVWTKRGLLITDPIERGLRVIEISILTEPATPHATTTAPTSQQQ